MITANYLKTSYDKVRGNKGTDYILPMNTFQHSGQQLALLLLLSISFSAANLLRLNAANLLRLNEHNQHGLDVSPSARTNVEGPTPNGIDEQSQSLLELQFTPDSHSHHNHIQMIHNTVNCN